MRNARFLVRVALLLAVFSLLITPSLTHAQASPATLVGRAVLPADTLADGPAAAQALGGRKNVRGLKVPFDTQPVGNITAIAPADYAGAWLALTEGAFDSPQNSGDYLLRIYTIEVDFRRADSGNGTATVVDWITLADPGNKAGKAIKLGGDPSRQLTGADFNPRAMARLANKHLWIADASGPSLLHFDARGQLVEAPIALSGAGALQGIAALPNGSSIVVAQRDNSGVVFRVYDTNAHSLGNPVGTLALDNGSLNVTGIAALSANQLLVIEQDRRENNGAQFKKVLLVDIGNLGTKTPVIDLLNITDPTSLSTANVFPAIANATGLGAAFKFPYGEISALYPLNNQTVVIVNDNNVPFGAGRSTSNADPTEFIAVQFASR
jgi:hypothetical protein